MSLAESVVELLLGKLAEPLIGEAVFLHGVREQVDLLVLEFERMVAFLEDADSKQEGDRSVKRWVQHVRDVAYDAEDVIDNFLYKVAPLRRRGFLGGIKRYACYPVELKALHYVGSEIQRINNKIHRISESWSTYGIADIRRGGGKSSADPILEERRLTSPDFEEADFVGFHKDSVALVKELTNIESEKRRCVVSVVGMGGLGKTTLTKKLYNADTVKKHFHIHAWISVSQEYSARDLLQTITKRCMVMSKVQLELVENMDVLQLSKKISEYLNDKRYLVVLDDIWKIEAWDALKDAFPDANNGSRVVLTTRNKDVALYADPQSQPHELPFLTNEEGWYLFCKKTFPGQDGGCPPELEELGKDIVKKCGGLPLAVVVTGGLLRTKTKEAGEWKKVHDSISWHLVEGVSNISGILSLSYKDLPYYLKPCFLYLGNFPEDYEFQAKELIRLWAAEGFLKERGKLTLEEVGEYYLMELVQRSMVQVTERSSSRGIKKCRIHDLLRDLSISKAEEGIFLRVQSGINANGPTSRARRLAVHNDDLSKYTSLKSFTLHLRSVLIYAQSSTWLQREEEKFLFRGFKLLRVLYVHGAKIEKLPKEIGELIHLRYLGCTSPWPNSLPSSIFNLPNLQTLFVPSGYKRKVPSTIGKMEQLRHLQLSSAVMKGHPRLEQIRNLQTLSKVKAGKWMEGCLRNLTNLRKLGIVLATTADAEVFNDSILKLGCLHSLSVSVEGVTLLVHPFSNLLKLSKLELNGRLAELPESAQFPVNLTKLTLESSLLREDQWPTLENLKKLRILKLLYDSYDRREMVCSSQGFPQLESLHLVHVSVLRKWIVKERAMPNLLHLRIDYCYKLEELPEGLQHVTTLKKLESWRMPSQFNKRLKEDGGEDWYKIRHIPSIDIRKSWTFDDEPVSAGEAAAPGAACAAEEEKKEEPAEESDDVAAPGFAEEAAAPAAACAAEEEKKEELVEESDDVAAPGFAGEAATPAAACAAEEEKKEEPAEESDDVVVPVFAGEATAPAAACAAEEEKKEEPAEESNDVVVPGFAGEAAAPVAACAAEEERKEEPVEESDDGEAKWHAELIGWDVEDGCE